MERHQYLLLNFGTKKRARAFKSILLGHSAQCDQDQRYGDGAGDAGSNLGESH